MGLKVQRDDFLEKMLDDFVAFPKDKKQEEVKKDTALEKAMANIDKKNAEKKTEKK